ncbi:MAG TPA: glycosyltransferase family 4 protein [Verrucomicrobiae bacterium]|jgi:glycosyltransferase involved in cell wall biosynthesis
MTNWRLVHSEASLGWGGQEHRIIAELAGFKKRGGEVWLLAPAESEIFRRAAIAKISTIPLRTDKLHFPFEAIRLARWLRQNQIQILNTHSSRDGWLAGIAGRMACVPLIIRTRHIDVDYPNRWLSRHAYATLADYVMTTSRKITAHFQEMFGLPDDRISTVPTGIDLDFFSPSGKKAQFFPDNKPHVGMISVLRSWKGHATFLQAARLLLDEKFTAHFVIVGEGPMRPRIERQIAELNLGSAVTLTGHREDVPDILRALNVLVVPSTKHEGVPQIGLQALATKTPVVGSDAGGIPEIIRHGETGRIFPANDAKMLAGKILETLADTETTRAMTERGRTLAEAQHGLDRMIEAIDALYLRHLPA